MSDPYRHAGEKLLEPVGEDLWPLAMVYFDPKTRGLKAGVLSTGAELIVGHGRKIGVIIEARARELCKQSIHSNPKHPRPTPGPAATSTPEPKSVPLSVEGAESE